MKTQRIGIIVNGVTGRMGTHQHLDRSLCAILRQGGVRAGGDVVLMPDLLLTGRREDKLRELAATYGPPAIGRPFAHTTDLEGALAGRHGPYEVFFDASATLQRVRFAEMALAAGKAVYCEKPTAGTTAEALRLARLAEAAGLKNGVVQDKLWLPGLLKLRDLIARGFFGRILEVRGDFGYWVFTGMDPAQPAPQRPSWNYRAEDGGGIVGDMFCHWQYVIANLFGPVRRLVAHARTEIDRRRDERGTEYRCTADDAAYAVFLLESGAVAQFNSSWCTRVRRDDLLTIQVDGTDGSAVAGLREVHVQGAADTPRAVWNPDIPQPLDLRAGWTRVPDAGPVDNAFKLQWEEFLRHVGAGAAWRYTLREGAKGVQFAELGLQSSREGTWIDVPALD